jgi:hypothetical protein
MPHGDAGVRPIEWNKTSFSSGILLGHVFDYKIHPIQPSLLYGRGRTCGVYATLELHAPTNFPGLEHIRN